MAHEGHAAVLAHVVGGGLADVVEKRAEAERLAARELVRERLVQHLAQLAGGLALELDQPLQHLERVPVDVEVVVVALLHVVEVGELGKHRSHQAEPVRECEPLHRSWSHQEAAQLREHALAGGLAHPGRRLGGEALGLGVRREAELGGEARQAQRAQRVVLVRRRAEHAQRAGLEVGPAAERVDQLAAVALAAAPSRSRVKSRLARSSSIVSPWSRAKSYTRPPRLSTTRQAPKASESWNTGPRSSAASSRAASSGSALDGDVDVRDLAAQQLVAQRAADYPGLAHRTGSRRILGRRPVVTS